MLPLREYIDETIAYIPQVDVNRCVHTKIEVSNCTNCVDICPHSAWNLDDESLSINTTTCVGCGLCVPVCPEAAIEYEYQHKAKNYNNLKVSVFACQRVNSVEYKEKNIFCINIISIFELLHLYANGTRAIFFSTGDCDNCCYHCSDGLVIKVKKINELLTSRQHKNIKLLHIKPKSLKTWLTKVPDFDKKSNRRMFLRHMFTNSVKLMTKKENNSNLVTMIGLLPANKQDVETNNYIYPFVPQIDESKCNLCNACIRLCPHQSFDLKQYALHILADTCTGCNICVDVCELDAIKVNLWSEAKQNMIKITTHSCVSCGVDFSIPATSDLSSTHCLICAYSNHHNNLHQIIDD